MQKNHRKYQKSQKKGPKYAKMPKITQPNPTQKSLKLSKMPKIWKDEQNH